jgi:hypothetical protein
MVRGEAMSVRSDQPRKRRDTEVGADTIGTWAKEAAAREGRPSEKSIEACDRLGLTVDPTLGPATGRGGGRAMSVIG